MPLVAQLPSSCRTCATPTTPAGWLRCDLDADGAVARYREVVDPADPASAVVDGAALRSSRRGRPDAVRV